MDMLQRLYNHPDFGIYLFSLIIVLVILFFIILVLALKDVKNMEKNKEEGEEIPKEDPLDIKMTEEQTIEEPAYLDTSDIKKLEITEEEVNKEILAIEEDFRLSVEPKVDVSLVSETPELAPAQILEEPKPIEEVKPIEEPASFEEYQKELDNFKTGITNSSEPVLEPIKTPELIVEKTEPANIDLPTPFDETIFSPEFKEPKPIEKIVEKQIEEIEKKEQAAASSIDERFAALENINEVLTNTEKKSQPQQFSSVFVNSDSNDYNNSIALIVKDLKTTVPEVKEVVKTTNELASKSIEEILGQKNAPQVTTSSTEEDIFDSIGTTFVSPPTATLAPGEEFKTEVEKVSVPTPKPSITISTSSLSKSLDDLVNETYGN